MSFTDNIKQITPQLSEIKTGTPIIKIGNEYVVGGIGGNFIPGAAQSSDSQSIIVEPIAGYFVNTSGVLTFHSLSDSLSESVSSVKIIDTGVQEPEYSTGGGGSSMNFYKCSSVDTSNSTWSGKLASIDNTTGVWSFASDSTTDLQYGRIIPVTGHVYDETCAFRIIDYNIGLPEEGLVFYASLNGNSPSETQTGQPITTSGSVTYTTVNGVPCISLNNNAYLYGTNTTGFPTGQESRTVSYWIKLNSHNNTDGSCAFSYGIASPNQRYTIGTTSSLLFIAGHSNTASVSYSFNLNQWYNIIAKYTDSTEFMYVNGVFVGSSSHANLNTGSAGWSIGAQYNQFNAGLINGYVSSVRLYNRALSTEEISSLASEFAAINA